MATLIPILTATPNSPTTYNTGVAETFSWVPVENDAGRPLYARATYLTNASDMSVSLSANSLNINLEDVENLLKAQLGQSGFVFLTAGETATGTFTTVQVASACKISNLAAANSTVGALTAIELPVNFSFNGPITSITLAYGAAFVYKL